MDKTTLIGLVMGFLALGVGMVMKGVPLDNLLNPAAFLIIIAGTAASVVIAFPSSEIKRVPKLFGILFKDKKGYQPKEMIMEFSDLAQLARKEGLLALEAKLDEVEDSFMRNGLSLAVDGQSADYIRDVLNEEIDAMEERHSAGAQIFSQAGTYAPTLGVLGAVIGLIAALGNMDNSDELGRAISAAFIATLLGIFTGYVLWHPFANKLKRKSQEEVRLKSMMVEGILSILEGEAPRIIEQKLSSYLPASERQEILEESGEMQDV